MIRAAIVGLGRWGQRLVDSVQDKSDAIRFVTGVTRDPGRSRAFADKAKLKLTSSYQEAIGSGDVDAVVLATPHSQHFAEIVAAAKAGKHVFVEKPMTLTAAHADAAVKACKESGVALGIGFGRRMAPAFRDMQRLVNDGRIGKLLHIEANFSGPTGYQLKNDSWRATRAEAPGGGMTARGIHTLDGMIALGGPIGSVYAVSARQKLEVDIDDTTVMLLRFADGKTGTLATIFATANFWRIHAFGTDGWAEMHGERSLSVSDLKGNIERKDYDAVDLEREVLENFAHAALSNASFVVPGEDAVNGIAVLEAIVASAGKNEPVKIA